MNPADAQTAFESFLAKRGVAASSLTPRAGFAALFDFYARERADGCDLAHDGDMLLYQWGTYDWGEGPAFELELVRQLTWPDGGDGDGGEVEYCLWQLHLTFRFPPTPALEALEAGDRWCHSPAQLAEFGEWLQSTAPFAALADTSGAAVSIWYESAE